ncbi:hypothetical protein HPB48_020124 [Haemaphysalis longicornis]|uniref:Ig-like domain-containing protein n=1 Tax=Haemaphysalis longicornis TaxID=44386 RepID=A0A9J6FZM6_HAELO|nr:hypothetical protein HPB48_020124 [Haemaphysalis longicornis]
MCVFPRHARNLFSIYCCLEVLPDSYADPPEIRYEGHPREEVEEGGSLTLSCVADANPTANIVWRKSGQSSIYDINPSITFAAIQRTDSGVYSCSAKNDFGDSPEIQVTVNVKCECFSLLVVV